MITKEAIEAGARGVYYAAELIKEHDDVDGLDWEVDWGDVKDSYPATHEHCVEVATACLNAAFAATPAPDLQAENDRLRAALLECDEYFDNRADADCDQDGYIPNAEMKMLTIVRAALERT